jgi:hypothetical protein
LISIAEDYQTSRGATLEKGVLLTHDLNGFGNFPATIYIFQSYTDVADH